MKLALILLLLLPALAVISHQQFLGRPGELLWFRPCSHSRPGFNNYQPLYYDDVGNHNPFFHQRTPPRHIFHPQPPQIDDWDYVMEMNKEDLNIAEPDDYVQSRSKGSLRPQNPRLDLAPASTINNPFIRTATFTLTSTVSLTSVQSCIDQGDFAINVVAILGLSVTAPPCRRRKRDIQDSSDEMTGDIQFPLDPMETQQVIPTELAELPQRPNSQEILATDQNLTSSHDNNELSEYDQHLKKKRFLLWNFYLASRTVTSYSFVMTTVTKTVDVANALGLRCLPPGFVIC